MISRLLQKYIWSSFAKTTQLGRGQHKNNTMKFRPSLKNQILHVLELHSATTEQHTSIYSFVCFHLVPALSSGIINTKWFFFVIFVIFWLPLFPVTLVATGVHSWVGVYCPGCLVYHIVNLSDNWSILSDNCLSTVLIFAWYLTLWHWNFLFVI